MGRGLVKIGSILHGAAGYPVGTVDGASLFVEVAGFGAESARKLAAGAGNDSSYVAFCCRESGGALASVCLPLPAFGEARKCLGAFFCALVCSCPSGRKSFVVLVDHVKQRTRKWRHRPAGAQRRRPTLRLLFFISSDAELDRSGENQADRHHRPGQAGRVQPAAPCVLCWVSPSILGARASKHGISKMWPARDYKSFARDTNSPVPPINSVSSPFSSINCP